MLNTLRERLEPTDSAERHLVLAALLDAAGTILDVGGATGQLAAFVPHAAITTVNVDEPADVLIEPGPNPLPFPDASFDAVVSLDTLEHIPPADRELFVNETLRLARQQVVLCCPLGSDLRSQTEQADNEWFRQRTGQDHPWTGEHLRNGVPDEAELRQLFSDPEFSVDFAFNGDIRRVSKQFRLAETSRLGRRPAEMMRWLAYRLTHPPDATIDRHPTPTTNRVFVIARRASASRF